MRFAAVGTEPPSGADGPQRRLGGGVWPCCLWAAAHRERWAAFAALEAKNGDSRRTQERVLCRQQMAMHAHGGHGPLEEAPMWRSTVGLIVILALGILVAPLTADTQPSPKMHRIGILWPGSRPGAGALFETFLQGLRDLGYVEGQNLAFEHRYGEWSDARLSNLAAELVQLNVDVILAPGTPPALAAQRATTTIPIVFEAVADPVEVGLVASLARPGGNLTGLTILAPEHSGKRLELLTEAVPGVSRVAVLWNPVTRWSALEVSVMADVARGLGIQLQFLEVRDPSEFERAFAAATREGAGALSILATPIITQNLRRIANLALQHRLPAIFWRPDFAEAGGLMAYGPSQRDMVRRAAALIGKILQGAQPADLPVEQPMRFELVINLKTAQELGLTIPPLLLFQADKVIQ
jgi:putative ABC transport system substrate-binding protein